MLRVDVDELMAAAARICGHGEELAARHLDADNRLESAAPGWAGRSAAALANRAGCWRDQSNRLIGRIGAHTTGLHDSALRFAAMDDEAAVQLSSTTAGAGAAPAIR